MCDDTYVQADRRRSYGRAPNAIDISPVLAPTRDHPFYTVIPTHRPIKSPFTTRLGYGGRILDLTPTPHPWRPHGGTGHGSKSDENGETGANFGGRFRGIFPIKSEQLLTE